MNILILGIGNILFQDEGIGAHFVHYIDEKYMFKSDSSKVAIMDGGTLAQVLIPQIVKYDKVIIIDCIDANNAVAGDVYFFAFDNMPNTVNWQGSAHEVEMLQTLNMIAMNGDLPETKIIGVIPKRVADDTTFDLSDQIVNAVATMEHTLVEELKKDNFQVEIRNPQTTIEQIAQISYKRDMINDFML